MIRSWRRGAAAFLLALVAWVSFAPAAGADPPGPTDYRTVVTSIDPPVPGLQARIIGGDSFFELRVPRGTEVAVVGYAGERFVEFLRSGEVREDRASITWWTSRSRYGADVPDHLGEATGPDWVTVAHDGRWSWHDHRAHWMNAFRPPGRQPGDQILEAVIPLVVDGEPVEITVRSWWLPAPSPVPAVVGAAAGAALAALVVWRRRRGPRWLPDGVVLVAALAAAVVGVAQARSVPAETGPPFVAWLLPLTALIAVGAAAVLDRRARYVGAPAGPADVRGGALRALAGVELVVWVVQRRDVLTAAILPTDAPFWLDRGVTAGVAVVAVVAAVTAGHALAVRLRAPRPEPGPRPIGSPHPGRSA